MIASILSRSLDVAYPTNAKWVLIPLSSRRLALYMARLDARASCNDSTKESPRYAPGPKRDETAWTEFARQKLSRTSRPSARRWEQTDDALQNATFRLYRALECSTPESPRSFFNLAALQIRRELIDLARHYYGPHGMGAHHASQAIGGREDMPEAEVAGGGNTHDPGRLAAWTDFHTQIDALPEQEKEVFNLIWYQELSQAEAANLLGVTERVVKYRWRSARLKLHEKLDGRLPD
jgi:RNA polymerase sigma factor (sigma-70 family)